MAQHKKSPLFLKVITTDKQIVCINPAQLSSFQIQKDASLVKLKAGVDKAKNEDDLVRYTADVVRFYFPSGTGMTYEVGKEITEENFNYIVATLQEWVYMNKIEFDAVSELKAKEALEKWNKDMVPAEEKK